ncbi:MAG: hypothetical protein BWY22_02532 [Bacteroidetes bacterium ADurb.Bin217]|nr:MAG: hypothetical protein BWY22_02532 [Bacteroidetes bacterium ADurb.Bin217]
MKYKKGRKIVKETTVSTGGVYGVAPGIGQMGGHVGNVDFYAPGDSRNLWGWKSTKKGKKNKKKKSYPLYRRTFVELLSTESKKPKPETDFSCVICSEKVDYLDVLKTLLEKDNIDFKIETDNIVSFIGSKELMENTISKLQSIISEEPFKDGEIFALFNETELSSKNWEGLAANKTINDFYKKYDPKGYYDIRDFKEHRFLPALRKGIKVEMEHTKNPKIAALIARDHIWEDIDYYKKLAKMEK